MCSHFNIEDGRKYATFLEYYALLAYYVLAYYFKKGKNATKTPQKICAVYGEGAVTDWTCQKWFAKFRAGGFSLNDAPRWGRPVEVDSNQIETLIENHQCSTTGEIADIPKIPKSIKLLVKMKNVSFILWKNYMNFWLTQYYQPSGKELETSNGP